MGFLKDIEDMPNQYDVQPKFFDRWYRPEYATIVVAGDVKAERCCALVEKYLGRVEAGQLQARHPRRAAAEGPPYGHVDWPSATLPWVTVAFHGPAFTDTAQDSAALDASST